jgi:predicted thioesterase
MVRPGTTLERKKVVTEQDAISFLGANVKPSLASPRMIGHMEFACRDAVLPDLDDGQDTVGTHVDVSHLAATPLGDEVTYRATVIEVEGRKLTFEVEASDSRELVGKGTHQRYIIDVERFAVGLKKRFG